MIQLALFGAEPAFPEGPPEWPAPDAEVREALERAYACGDWGRYHGRECAALAEELAAFHTTPHVTLCCSGTVAVELALRGLGVSEGDEVILAGYDFPGNFRAIEAIGARPVLVDVSPDGATLDSDQFLAALSEKTRAAIVSHLHGELAPIGRLMEIAKERDLKIVEDACQAPGATVEGAVAGTRGHVGVLSFGGSKLLTAGRGGAVLTSDRGVHQRIKVFSERGNQAFPLSELQAAVLRPQLVRLPERNRARLSNARRLIRRLDATAGVRPMREAPEGSSPAFYKLGLWHVADELAGVSRERFLAAAAAEGLALHAGFRGFAGRGARRCRKQGPLVNSARAAESMMVLHHPILLAPPERIDRVGQALERISQACQTGELS